MIRVISPLIAAALILSHSAVAEPFRFVYERSDVLPEVEIDGQTVFIHTQGLYVTDDHYLVTGRLESKPKRSLLLRFSRKNLESYELIDIMPPPIDGATLDHPGGFDVDSKGRLWIPISTSHSRGPSLICRYVIEANKPLTPRKPDFSFRVDDHIGAICWLRDDSLFGANWDTKQVYLWSADGSQRTRIDRRQLFADSPRWQLAVQDWKSIEYQGKPLIIAGGLDKTGVSSKAVIQVIDFEKRQVLQSLFPPHRQGVSRPMTNEGIAFHAGKIYLLPEDIGRGAKVLVGRSD